MTTIQSLAHTIMQEFDVTQGGQFSYDEFANFLDGFAETISAHQTSTAANSAVLPEAITTPSPTGSLTCAAANTAPLIDCGDPRERS